jgi:hypothetical protein
VAQLIRANAVLTTLNLRSCGLHANGIATIAAALADNRSLTHLDLSGNEPLSSAGLAALAKAARVNRSLQVSTGSSCSCSCLLLLGPRVLVILLCLRSVLGPATCLWSCEQYMCIPVA